MLALVDRNGKREVLGLPPGSYDYPRLSPEGKQLAVVTNEEGGTIWIYDMSGDFSAYYGHLQQARKSWRADTVCCRR